jgi:hypothetical protein
MENDLNNKKMEDGLKENKMEDDLKNSTKINLIGCDSIVNSPSEYNYGYIYESDSINQSFIINLCINNETSFY